MCSLQRTLFKGEKEMKWRIVGFYHPKQEKSVVYRQGLNEAQLIETIKKGIENGCNLFSIRGFEE